MDPAKEQEFETVICQLEFGVPPDLTVFMRVPFSLSRGECLILADRGIRSPLALAAARAENSRRNSRKGSRSADTENLRRSARSCQRCRVKKHDKCRLVVF